MPRPLQRCRRAECAVGGRFNMLQVAVRHLRTWTTLCLTAAGASVSLVTPSESSGVLFGKDPGHEVVDGASLSSVYLVVRDVPQSARIISDHRRVILE